MNKKILFSSLAVFLLFSASASYWLNNWKISDDYQIQFSARGAKGSFSQLEGIVKFDKNNLQASKVDVSVAVNTIETGNDTKNKHAKNSSWLDAENYPSIKIKSNNFERSDNGYVMSAQLELRGVKKNVSIPFTFEENDKGGIFQGSFKVNRKDYGIKGPLFGFTVSNEVTIDIKVPVLQ